MRKILALLVVFLLAFPAVLAEDSTEVEISEDNVARFELGQARVQVLASVTLVRMDTVMEVLDEYGADQETLTQLDQIRNEFADLADTVEDFTSRAGLREGTEQLRDLVSEFREIAKEALGEYEVDKDELKETVKESIESSEEVAEAKENFAEVLADHTLQRYENQLAKMERIVERISETHEDFDVSELEELIDEYESVDIESAIESGDPEEVRATFQELRAIVQDFHEEVRDLLGEPDQEHVPRFKFRRATMFLNQMSATIDDLGELGFDTEELEEIYADAQDAYDSAKEAAEEGTFEDVKEFAQEFRELAKAFLTEVRDLVGDDEPIVEELEVEIETL
jgi:tetratricopeptide (TPR) repeat protein